jgi:hypothetical protein
VRLLCGVVALALAGEPADAQQLRERIGRSSIGALQNSTLGAPGKPRPGLLASF